MCVIISDGHPARNISTKRSRWTDPTGMTEGHEETISAVGAEGQRQRAAQARARAEAEAEQQSPKPPAKDGLSLEWLSAEQRGGGRPGRWYYWNAKTRESSWADPIQPVDSDDGAAAAGQPARAAGSPGMAGL